MPATDTSLRPQMRPAAMVSQATAVPDGQPAIVRQKATQALRFDPTQPMLIGTFGSEGAPYALIRLPSGRIEKVARGDRIGSATVAGIAEGIVILSQSGRTRRLALP